MAKIKLIAPVNLFYHLLRNNRGVGMIEAAVILPILLAIVFAGIEFGFYFSRQSVMQNAVGVVSATVQTYSPNTTTSDAANLNTNLQNLYTALGSGSVAFAAGNFCGKAFPTQAAAQSFIDGADPCGGSTGFHVGRTDAGVAASDPYYVGLISKMSYSSFTPMSALSGIVMPSNVISKMVVYVSPSFGSGGGGLPTGCSDGQIAKMVGGTWQCASDNTSGGSGLSAPSSVCTGSSSALQWNGSSFTCGTVSGGGGGGVAAPSSVCTGSSSALQWNGSSFTCGTVSGGGGGGLPIPPTSSASNQALYWNGSNWAYRSFTTAPTCAANNILAWNGSSYVCLPYPSTCPAGSFVTWTGTSFGCIPYNGSACSAGSVVTWNGSSLVCTTPAASTPIPYCTTGFIYRDSYGTLKCGSSDIITFLKSYLAPIPKICGGAADVLGWNGSSWYCFGT